MTSTASLLDVAEICKQRLRRQILVPPPLRLDVVSPYPQYTQQQLNMRRKIEVLQYNTLNSKSKKLTKAERYTQLSQGITQRRSYTNQQLDDIANGRFNCPSDSLLPTLTSSCDVPGPVETLQLDPNIPLYNYAGVLNYAFSENNSNLDASTIIFFPFTPPMTTLMKNESGIVATLFVKSSLFNNLFRFQINAPVSLVSPDSTVSPVSQETIIYMYVYYNELLVATNNVLETLSVPSPYPLNNPTEAKYESDRIVGTATLYGRPGFIYDVRFKSPSTNLVFLSGMYVSFGNF